jgi:hypothetical protein
LLLLLSCIKNKAFFFSSQFFVSHASALKVDLSKNLVDTVALL